MLQIASGKLFRREPGQRNDLRGVLYTNLHMYDMPPIETAAGRLLLTSPLHDLKTLVYEFTELIEDEPAVGVIKSHTIDPYLNDFAAVVSFALDVTCTPDADLTRRLTSGRFGPSVQHSPKGLVRRVFDDVVWCTKDDADHLEELVGKLIGLERKNFLAAMRAIRSYVTGLHRLADDYELAYTLLVVAIESLAQKFDGYQPQWEDYENWKRHAIDAALAGADEATATRVREALLEIEHVALGRRFRDYTLDHLQPSYFREEARDMVNPVGLADLTGALRQAYNLRSGYIHELEELPNLIKLGTSYSETVLVDGRILLTFQGLTRLARHVITAFIQRQPQVDKEEYDYSNERFGIVQMQWAPQHWIGGVEGLNAASGQKRLEGLLRQVTACLLQEPEATVTDLRKMLTQVEGMLPGMNADQRRPFIALYVLFNVMSRQDAKMENYEQVVERYGHELDDPSVESMLAFLLLGIVPEWSLAEHRQVHDDYFLQKNWKAGLRVSPTLEAGLCLTLAERYRRACDVEQAQVLIRTAVENHSGHVPLYELERDFDPAAEIRWKAVVAPPSAHEVNEELAC